MSTASTLVSTQMTVKVPAQGAENPLAVALAHVTDAVIVTDIRDRITYMNAAAEILIGTQHVNAAGQLLKNVLTIVHADTNEAMESAIEAVKSTDDGARNSRHAVLVGEAGNPVVIEYYLAAIRDAAAMLSGAIVIFRDITNRRAAELAMQVSEETLLANAQALFEEKERSQVTLNSIGDAVISTDFRGRVSFLNRSAERMTGWTQAEATGSLPDEVFFVVDSSTREHVAGPTMTAIIEDRRVQIDAACVLIRRDGAEIPVEASASPIHDKNGGVVGAVMVVRDVTAARELSTRLARLALHDVLTALPNRALFADRLERAITQARDTGTAAAVLFVDLDRFKPVNDSLGHDVGDRLLSAVAQRLTSCVRHVDTVGRYGGDEFVILAVDLRDAHESTVLAEKVTRSLGLPYEIDGNILHITASLGIACFPDSASDPDTLLKYADIAMYEAKRSGTTKYRIFTQGMLPGAAAANAKLTIPSP